MAVNDPNSPKVEKAIVSYVIDECGEAIPMMTASLCSIVEVRDVTQMYPTKGADGDIVVLVQEEEKELDVGATGHNEASLNANMPKIPRHRSRIQEKGDFMQYKEMARKADIKGTTSCSPPSSPTEPCSLDIMARVCGFSLGQEETTRLANISLIQAKEEAFLALQKVKHKIDLSSVVMMSPILELEGISVTREDDLLPIDQG